MEQIVSFLVENPLYLAGAVVIAVIILLVTLKKLLRLAIVVVAVFILYVAYLYLTGSDASQSVLALESFFREGIRFVVEYLKNLGS
ncbi:hypothetical protein CR161_10010 [Prosthecochloris sp. ZM]|uniref:hypothetical protein n=1 Tax=Prosthecochloris sp. ZM TaxID=2283143 RepID=UPI000DF7F898|nr:hypothetical protein [Prosthecochloris sp. ZM]RDD31005.1 hypothetical protein CR161_10010 [Prosthecochloris sp. ZM]